MRILMIAADRRVFEEGTDIRERMIRYGKHVEALDIIVFSGRGFARQELSGNVIAHPTNSLNRFLRPLDAVRIGRRLPRPNLITAQDIETGVSGLLLARAMRVPLEAQLHTDIFSPYFVRASLLNRVRRLLARIVLPRAACVRVVSQRIKDSLERAGIALVHPAYVLPIAVPEQEQVPDDDIHARYPQFDFIVLAAGRLEPEKDFETMLAAFAGFQNRSTHAGLVIAGEGSARRRVAARARAHGIEDAVVLAGRHDELPVWMASADAFLHTSRYEGYGIVFIEAARAGVPLITTDVGIIGDILRDGEHVRACPVGDVECLRDALTETRGDFEGAKRRARAARAAIERLGAPDPDAVPRAWRRCATLGRP